MKKVDIVIGVLGIVALGATLAGVFLFDDLAGNQDLVFPERAVALEAQTDTIQGATMFNFTLPENATAADLDIEVVFTGQAVQGGSATVEIVVQGPTGDAGTFTESLTIPAGGSSARATFEVLHRWAEPPEPTTGDPDVYTDIRPAGPLTVTISVTQPSDPLPLASYNFDANVGGDAIAYHVEAERPDPQVN